MLNFYRGIAQKRGANWPRFNMALHGLHALVDQEYTGDINIVPVSASPIHCDCYLILMNLSCWQLFSMVSRHVLARSRPSEAAR